MSAKLQVLRNLYADSEGLKEFVATRLGASNPYYFNTSVQDDKLHITYLERGIGDEKLMLMSADEATVQIHDYRAQGGHDIPTSYLRELSEFAAANSEIAASPDRPAAVTPQNLKRLRNSEYDALTREIFVGCTALKQDILVVQRMTFWTDVIADDAGKKYLRISGTDGVNPVFFNLDAAEEYALKWLSVPANRAKTSKDRQDQISSFLSRASSSEVKTKEVDMATVVEDAPQAVRALFNLVDNSEYKKCMISPDETGKITLELIKRENGDYAFTLKGGTTSGGKIINYTDLRVGYHSWALEQQSRDFRPDLAELLQIEQYQSVKADYTVSDDPKNRQDTALCHNSDVTPRSVAAMTEFERVFVYAVSNAQAFKQYVLKEICGASELYGQVIRTFVQTDLKGTPYITLVSDRGQGRSPYSFTAYTSDMFLHFLSWLASQPNNADISYYGKRALESRVPEFAVGTSGSKKTNILSQLPSYWQKTKETETMDPKPGMTTPASINVRRELTAAAIRSGSRQLVKTAQPLMAAAISAKGGANGPQIAEFLQTDLGREMLRAAMAGALSGAANFKIPGLPQEHVAALAEEFRVETAANLGEMFADVFLGPLREVMSAMIASSQISVEQVRAVGVDTEVLGEQDDLQTHKVEVKQEKPSVEEVVASVQEKPAETAKKGRH